ncbi:spore gernimation protein GerXB [Sporosarcina globispora]|uniref:Spore gernimation protein GerXB n=1 Tax=Sporosarcina globispora TaxID=1459 RepID=A0A0M0GEH8_SPOGL|nr:endospore germination permease [Sporosarcina globispora]KON87836.1 spore gernimation protein GerXB [Sporosarcina globispora]
MKYSRLQISFMLILFTGISNHVMILPHLLRVANRDAWVCALAAYGILLLWGILIYVLLRRLNGESLYGWSKDRAGIFISKGLMFVFALYFFVTGTLSSYDFILLVKVYFLPLTPGWIVSGCFFILCIWAAFKGLKVIVYVSAALLPIVWLLGFFVAFATWEEKEYSILFPILMDGFEPLMNGTLVVLGGSIDLLVLLLIQDKLQKSYKYLHILILITVLLGLVLGPTMGSIASFGPSVASSFRFPAFEQWRLVQLGRQISHLDFLAVFQFLSGSIIKVSLCLFFLTDLFEIKTKKTNMFLLLIFGGLFSIVSIVPLSDLWLQKMIAGYYYPILFLMGFSISLFLFIISFLPKKKGSAIISGA